MNFEKTQKEKGFTLIELLVVISIIALLSTLVLAGIQDARTKAQNTKLNEIARQYLNAIELYSVSNNSTYPTTGGTDVCLGYSSSEACFGSFTGDDSIGGINDNLDEYYPDMPKNENFSVNIFGTLYARGILFDCTSSTCLMYWYLSGPNEKCLSDATPSQAVNATRCEYNLLN